MLCTFRTLRFVLAFLAISASAEQLPIRAYGPADGFPSRVVEAITRDSRGFLWFATREGLAQFDGYEFRTYDKRNGLPRDEVFDFLETRDGVYWAATADGLAKFDPNAPVARKFTVYRPDSPDARRIRVLYEDRSGQIWCGTENGLFRLRRTNSGQEWQMDPVPLVLDSGKPPIDPRISSILLDSHGNLWLGTIRALYRRSSSGRLSEFQISPPIGVDFRWNALFEDSAGRLWAGAGYGLWRILPKGPDEYTLVPVFVPKQRLVISSMLSHPDGGLWLGTSSGLIHWIPSPDGLSGTKRLFNETNGLSHVDIAALATDCEGNLWMGTDGGGAMRLSPHDFVTFTSADGLSIARHGQPTLFRDRSGEVDVALHHVVNVQRGGSFIEYIPAVPIPPNGYPGWGWHQSILRDVAGEWWFATGTGLVRFPDVPVETLARTRPKAVYTDRDGLRTSDIFRIFEDSDAGIWIACIGPLGVNGLSRWDRHTSTLRHFPSAHPNSVASAFAEGHDRTIWIGYYDGALGRYRNGSFTYYTGQDGLADGGIQALHVDRAGRLWIASRRGLTRVDAPAEEQPRFRRFGTVDGLSSNVMLCIAEDSAGRIYLATGRGIDRIDAGGEITGATVRHYTEANGLTKGDLVDVLVDRHGDLWASSKLGISRLTPEARQTPSAPPVVIRGLRIRGVPYPLSDLGETRVGRLTFASDQNQFEIDFSTLAFAPGVPIKYQYRLDPADRDWTEPSDQRTVTLSTVSPGSYRFSVRFSDGGLGGSGLPAILEFTILAPVWQRWWFRLTMISAMLGIIYWLHHYRTLRVVELERVRTRIASDLHDDIGSGLSQIAVLSEVARAQLDGASAGPKSTLMNIGLVSRELSECMSDIVWSVNPRRDRLSDLTQRMRRFSSDLLSGSNIDLHFLAPLTGEAVPIPAQMRREVFLIFKEAVNNLTRHSGCSRAEIEVSIEDASLKLRVEDNGTGMGDRCHEGNGLRSMTERARRLGGAIEIGRSAIGGVCIVLRVPVRASRLRRWIPTGRCGES
jgi:ligand-binding sensor domain-containing protein